MAVEALTPPNPECITKLIEVHSTLFFDGRFFGRTIESTVKLTSEMKL
jgi:hypothetical protein